MKFKHTGLFLFVWITLSATGFSQSSNPVHLSENAVVSILTMGPDKNELYSAFGHNAIRVFDPENNIDKAYNYGTFNYNDPNFYINFTKGNLLYYLSVSDYSLLKRFYLYYDRFINEQILDLNPQQVQRLFSFLENNALPENASYYYDYFYDNCSSRIRDVFVSVFQDSIRFDLSFIESEMTIRQLTDLYIEDKFPWGDLGIDICLGLPMDQDASPYEYMFLPDFIESGFDHAYIYDDERGERPIVKVKNIVYQSNSVPEASFFSPLVVSLILLVGVIIITWFNWQKVKKDKGLDFTLFLIIGLIGILLSVLWFATDHKAAAYNFNILWAIPFHAIAAFSLLKSGMNHFWRWYFKITAIVTFLLLLSWNFLPQDLHYSLIPIVLIVLIRSVYFICGRAYNANY